MATCPECGGPLEASVNVDTKTKQIKVQLYCEGEEGDRFRVEIATGLTNRRLTELKSKPETVAMKVSLIEKEGEDSFL